MSNDRITRLNAALEGRYSIESELGEGGMATVYLAHDLKHERKVALKVLKPELAAVVGAERFLAEIKTTAHLQHPHILPLFDSGEADTSPCELTEKGRMNRKMLLAASVGLLLAGCATERTEPARPRRTRAARLTRDAADRRCPAPPCAPRCAAGQPAALDRRRVHRGHSAWRVAGATRRRGNPSCALRPLPQRKRGRLLRVGGCVNGGRRPAREPPARDLGAQRESRSCARPPRRKGACCCVERWSVGLKLGGGERSRGRAHSGRRYVWPRGLRSHDASGRQPAGRDHRRSRQRRDLLSGAPYFQQGRRAPELHHGDPLSGPVREDRRRLEFSERLLHIDWERHQPLGSGSGAGLD